MERPFDNIYDHVALVAIHHPTPSPSMLLGAVATASKRPCRHSVLAPPRPTGGDGPVDGAPSKTKAPPKPRGAKRPPRDPSLLVSRRNKMKGSGKAAPADAVALEAAAVVQPPLPLSSGCRPRRRSQHQPSPRLPVFTTHPTKCPKDFDVDVIPSQEMTHMICMRKIPILICMRRDFLMQLQKEDCQIPKKMKMCCYVWHGKMSIDAPAGREQPMATYWKRIKEFFDACNTNKNGGSDSSLHYLWVAISTDCQKFSSFLTHAKHINSCGCSPYDKLNISEGLFRTRWKKGEKKNNKEQEQEE